MIFSYMKAEVVLCVNLLGMPHFTWKFFWIVLFLLSCKNEKSLNGQLMVDYAQTILRSDPSEKSKEIIKLIKGQSLVDLGEVGPSESLIAQGAEVFQTPWIKVQTMDDQTGWVQAWTLKPTYDQGDWLLQKRLICYFGKTLEMRRNVLLQNFTNVKTEEQFAKVWRESCVLRDTFLQLQAKRPERGIQMQFNWLGTALPGFIFQKDGMGEQPKLFADFKIWQQKALKTKGLQDDAFIQTYLLAFPKDSIESFFPAWKFQITETESASQLGVGEHLKILHQIDQALVSGLLFKSLLEALKEQLLEDIYEKNIHYWQPKEKILKEITQILADPLTCLDSRERESLNIRRKMFEDPEGSGIVVNLRSGE